MFGEDKAFDYLKGLHKNISNYPKSGTGPVKAVARGEAAVGVSFMHDNVAWHHGVPRPFRAFVFFLRAVFHSWFYPKSLANFRQTSILKNLVASPDGEGNTKNRTIACSPMFSTLHQP